MGDVNFTGRFKGLDVSNIFYYIKQINGNRDTGWQAFVVVYPTKAAAFERDADGNRVLVTSRSVILDEFNVSAPYVAGADPFDLIQVALKQLLARSGTPTDDTNGVSAKLVSKV